jgi:hypothetical protein
MAQLKLNRAIVVDGVRHDAGDVVDYSGDDIPYIVGAGFAFIANDPALEASKPTPPSVRPRTKAQIEADLAAAKAAEAQLQSDLSQAPD